MTLIRRLVLLGAATLACSRPPPIAAAAATPPPRFELAASCMVCHGNLVTPRGEDVSFGSAWRSSMMASSARDPYWHAGVRREVLDHPAARAAIENECSRCHMPMAHVLSGIAGRKQEVLAHVNGPAAAADPFALEGIACGLCHQIADERLGERASFTGGFVVRGGARRMFGPYEIAPGNARLMASAVAAEPTRSIHVQRSELCATCHTLYTHALDASGRAIGELPEQVPYEEWLHSSYRETTSCQGCHMPELEEPTPISALLGEPRPGVSRHDFRGGNVVVLSMLNAGRAALGVTASTLELDAAIARTRAFLAARAARVRLAAVARGDGTLVADVVVENLAGHKLPTAYPSRRAWLRVTVVDADGRRVFASGELAADGAIEGNDNDRDPGRFEPHHAAIGSPDEVQIYEAILGDPRGGVTTGLLTAVTYLKDNRVLPRGFDKRSAPAEVAVAGGAREDADFVAGEDRVRYAVRLGAARPPFTVEAELWYQPIGFRWAETHAGVDSDESRRFLSLHRAVAPFASAVRLAAADRAVVP
jgi:hypothetical protein